MLMNSYDVWFDIQAIRKGTPLIHNITNYVVMEQTANALLAIGASPVMAHALEEAKEMAMIADSLVLNIGTLSPPWVEGMMLALRTANSRSISVVFDPVGVGATPYRKATAQSILSVGEVKAIRGNASEIAHLNDRQAVTRGVDSLLEPSACLEQAKLVANQNRCVVWMSGKTDLVTDGHQVVCTHNGHHFMEKVTGMGCIATALVGAFLAVNQNPLAGSVHAAILMGVAGEIASENSVGPGSFYSAFIDTLYNISESEIEKRMRVAFV